MVLDDAAQPPGIALVTAVTVVLCSHNPRPDYLAATIGGLNAQTLPTECWELLVVDNASAPGRAPDVDLSWHPVARVIREDALGLTPARLRGIREAQAGLLVFVDDDNVLDPDFLVQALALAEANPHLGAWSGRTRPRFDAPPPEWTRRYWGNLVIRDLDRDVWSNLPRLAETMPCGAGLCVRRAVAQHYLALHEAGGRRFVLDRAGDSLVSGGDNDLAACACDVGLGVGLFRSLSLEHLIPPERLTEGYLARLAEGIEYSSVLLDAERGRVPAAPSALRRAATWLQPLRHRGPHRTIQRAVLRGRTRARRVLSAQSNPVGSVIGRSARFETVLPVPGGVTAARP